MMICNNDELNTSGNLEHQLISLKGNLVPQKASFFSSLENEVKKIIRACQFSKTNGRTGNWIKGRMNHNRRSYVLKKKHKQKSAKDKTENTVKRIGNSSIKRENVLGRTGQSPNCLANRNWQKLSIHPFINFMRVFRKKAPSDCPMNIMKLKARDIWRRMDKERKYPYLEQALKAKQKGYVT